jgi:hypothetical protein
MDALLNWLTKLDLRRSQFCKWSDLVSYESMGTACRAHRAPPTDQRE